MDATRKRTLSLITSGAVVALAVVVPRILTGCNVFGGSDATPKETVAATTPAPPPAEEPKQATEEEKDAQLGAKLSKYIHCINHTTKLVFNDRRTYLNRADREAGPNLKRPPIAHTTDPDVCFDSLKEAQKMEPRLPELDQVISAYKTALEELTPITKRAHDYYDQKDYADDNLKAGKEMHPQLVAAYEKFEKANEAFEAKVVQLNDSVSSRRLVRLKNDPKRQIEYQLAQTLHDAKQLILEVEKIETLDQVSAEFEKKLESFEKQVDAFEQFVESHKDDKEMKHEVESFPREVKPVLKAAKALSRRKRDGEDFNKAGGSSYPEHIEGHPAQVIHEYNDMIADSNRIRW